MYGIGMLLFAFADQGWMMFAILLIYCLGGIAGPALQSVITAKVPANEQGDLQGALTSVVSITSIIGPPSMTNSFYYFTHGSAPFRFPGAPFFLGLLLKMRKEPLLILSPVLTRVIISNPPKLQLNSF